MSENVQLIIAAACWVIVISFLVQVVVWILIYLTAKKAVAAIQDARAKIEPNVATVMKTVGELQVTVREVTESVSTVSTEVRAVSAAMTTSAERVSALSVASVEELRETIAVTTGDIKSLVTVTAAEIKELVTSTSNDVREVMTTSKDAVHGTVDRMDLMVERTARRVEDTSAYIQAQVLDPVREVSAIVTGVKVALETLIGYPERKQINQAYSEEELFI
jgi:methyl-accepting chemotaxis protein